MVWYADGGEGEQQWEREEETRKTLVPRRRPMYLFTRPAETRQRPQVPIESTARAGGARFGYHRTVQPRRGDLLWGQRAHGGAVGHQPVKLPSRARLAQPPHWDAVLQTLPLPVSRASPLHTHGDSRHLLVYGGSWLPQRQCYWFCPKAAICG